MAGQGRDKGFLVSSLVQYRVKLSRILPNLPARVFILCIGKGFQCPMGKPLPKDLQKPPDIKPVNPNKPFERNCDAFSIKLVDLSVYLVISTNYFAAID